MHVLDICKVKDCDRTKKLGDIPKDATSSSLEVSANLKKDVNIVMMKATVMKKNFQQAGVVLCQISTKLSYSEREELFKLKLSSLLDSFV